MPAWDIAANNSGIICMEELMDSILSFFENRYYSSLVDEMNIHIYTQDFYNYLVIHERPIYYEEKNALYKGMPYKLYHLLSVDIVLPDEFSNATDSEAVKMIGDTLIKYFTEVNLPLKIRKSFDKGRFVADLKTFFDGY